jgi:excisionase family DNA binding protein
MAQLSLREAADACGVSKSTILRAIKSGRMSAPRTDEGGYAIDPAELHRVYPLRNASAPERTGSVGQDAPPAAPGATAVLEAEITALREMLRRADREADDLRADRDAWRSQAENSSATVRLLTDQTSRRSWWKRLVG